MVLWAINSPPTWAAVLGLLSHWAYFIHGEHHMQAPIYGSLFLVSIPLMYLVELYFSGYRSFQIIKLFTETISPYLLSLFLSIIVYRLFFHRLREFPGPLGARVSKLWHAWYARTSQNHLLLDRLCRDYGTFVRTGPEELTIFDPEALWAMSAPGSACIRTPFYDAVLPMKSLANVRDPGVHDQRRRIWDQAFSTKAMRNYEIRITKYSRQFDQHLTSTAGQPVNAYQLISFYTSDLMGDLAFGKSFNNLVDQESNEMVKSVRDFMGVLGALSPIPWFARLGSGLLRSLNGWKRFMEFTKQSMNKRILTEPPVPDVSSYLIAASTENGTLDEDRDFLEGDALVLIIVGSDSMATTLIHTLANVARYPLYQQKIFAELQSISSVADFAAVMKLQVLKSVIMETLRLWPPIPTGPGRIVPRGGLTIAGKYIPAGTTIFAPRYTISRSEGSFDRATEFVPERWTTKPEMVKDRRAYAPFSNGRYNCVGQTLAMKTVSHLMAVLISRYHIEFAPGDDGTRVIHNCRDNFTMDPGRLDLIFKLRKGEEP